jgi:hypothetical protein
MIVTETQAKFTVGQPRHVMDAPDQCQTQEFLITGGELPEKTARFLEML